MFDPQSVAGSAQIMARYSSGSILLVRGHITHVHPNTQGKATAALRYTEKIAEADAQVKWQMSDGVPGVSADHEADDDNWSYSCWP